MARRFQCERRPSYSTSKESMNGRQYSGLFPRQFVTVVTVQRITENKTVVLFLSSEEGEFRCFKEGFILVIWIQGALSDSWTYVWFIQDNLIRLDLLSLLVLI
jgi:hypothetical protein